MERGVDAASNPEFSQLGIDNWFCRGWHSGDGARTETKPTVNTHQLLNFDNRFGAKTIPADTADGIELADIGKLSGYLNCLF